MPSFGSLGTETLGEPTLGGWGFFDLPEVNVTSVTATTGPTVTVNWTYSQAQGAPQVLYRVALQDTSIGGNPVFYESGWLSGAITSYEIDVVALEYGGFLDAGGYDDQTFPQAVVQVATWADSSLVDTIESLEDTLAFNVDWGQPTVTITSPVSGSVVETSPLTVTWNYSDSDALAQGSFRVKLIGPDSGVVLYDSGYIVSAGTSHLINFQLLDDVTYEVEVEARNVESAPGFDTNLFQVSLEDVINYTPSSAVGPIYDIGINGVGYILADNPEKTIEYRRGTLSLDPQRFADGSTEFYRNIERYWIQPQGDFSGGAGQKFMDRDRSDRSKFYLSEDLDPFTVTGEMKPVLGWRNYLASTPDGLATVVGDYIFVATTTSAIAYNNDGLPNGGGGTWTTLSTIADTTGTIPAIEDMTSDGKSWYIATGRSIIRGLLASPGADWTANDATRVKWAAGRICAAVKSGTSTTGNNFITYTDSGTAEATHLSLPENWTIELGGTAGGFFYFAAYAGTQGSVYAWKLGLDEGGQPFIPFIAWDLPRGLIPIGIGAEGDQVWVRTYQPEGSGSGAQRLYRGVPGQDGNLTPFLIANLPVLDVIRRSGITSIGDIVFVGGPAAASDEGVIGAVSLTTGGYTTWFKRLRPWAVVAWQGQLAQVTTGAGLYVQDGNASPDLTPVPWINFSIVDGNSVLDKVFDTVTLATRPLTAGQSIAIYTSTDQGDSYQLLATMSGAGLTKQSFPVMKKAESLGIRLQFTGSPTLQFMQLRFHQLGLADSIVVVPIACSDNLSGNNGAALAENGPGVGQRRARTLEQLSQQRVLFQDVDFPWTGSAEVYELVNTETISTVGMPEARLGHKNWSLIVAVTLRKVGTV